MFAGARGFHRRLEALDRVAAALDVRIVGGEETDIVARVGDDPACVLVRIGRDADLALDEFGRLHRHLLQPFLVPVEGVVGAIHVAHPAWHPRRALFDDAELQPREAVEHAIDDQRGQRLHRRIGDRHVVDRLEIVVAAVEVGHRRQAVVEPGILQQLPAAADMEHDRQAGLLGDRPQRIEADVAGRMIVRAARRDHQRLGAHVDRFARGLRRLLKIDQRDVAGRQQAPVDRAEIDHVAGMGAGHGIGELGIAAAFEHRGIVEQGGGEHELAGKAQQVDRARAVLLLVRAQRFPVLGEHDLRVVEVGGRSGLEPGAVKALVARKQHAVGHDGAMPGFEVFGQEPGRFHDVCIGVVNDATTGVGHGSSSVSVVCGSLA